MTTRMLVDANHAEETRVVVIKGNRLEEFDVESSTKKQIKGNIYLAKVTRVEPSLQAAFVDYGGNRHGFLAFNEIHPDYYQIPIEDREVLLQEEAEQAAQDAALDDAEAESVAADGNGDDDKSAAAAETAGLDDAEISQPADENEASEGDGSDISQDDALEASESGDGDGSDPGEREAEDEPGAPEAAESVGAADEEDEAPRPRARPRRSYKIQEVIKKRQILLVQVVKEERGNKGAALTTYLSLAGRYCVLMPNTARGGGISRKITNHSARRKLKTILSDLEVPEGMGVIVRTAGMNRTKSEIKRDFDYLFRVWDGVRETTLDSSAPSLVYEEANLIKRAIRDLYAKEVDEVLVEGDEGYRTAKHFMRMLMPSHAKKVQPYRERVPLFHRFQVEQQMDAMYSNVVTLKSGGYLVINPTEALVAVDVNSGRSTKGANIEETALKTNLEAAEELARQLRLRDLAGLIVVDFIDMDVNRNNRSVERRMKDCLKTDRARIQVGRISSFGLLEMSRQRMRPSLLETSTVPCQYCDGLGLIRSTESTVLHVLRGAEEEGIRNRAQAISISVPSSIALYLLNQKRENLLEIEQRYAMHILVNADDDLIPPNYTITVDEARRDDAPAPAPAEKEKEKEKEAVVEEEDEAVTESTKPKRRRQRRRKKEDAAVEEVAAETTADSDDAPAAVEASDAPAAVEASEDKDEDEVKAAPRRRRGRRGGRKRKAAVAKAAAAGDGGDAETVVEADLAGAQKPEEGAGDEPADTDLASETADHVDEQGEPELVAVTAEETVSEEPASAPEEDVEDVEDVEEAAMHDAVVLPLPGLEEVAPPAEPDVIEQADLEEVAPKSKRRGWWQRATGK